MISLSDLALVGKVNKTHGVDGELSMSFFSDGVLDALDVDDCLLFVFDGIFVPFFVESVRPRGSESLLVSLVGESSRDAAAAFVGKDVYMRRADVAAMGDEDEHDESDGLFAAALIGFEAFDAKGVPFGVINDIDDNPDNPLFIVRPAVSAQEVFVPIVDEFIVDIDLKNRKITFDLPEGLLNIN